MKLVSKTGNETEANDLKFHAPDISEATNKAHPDRIHTLCKPDGIACISHPCENLKFHTQRLNALSVKSSRNSLHSRWFHIRNQSYSLHTQSHQISH